MEHLSAILSPIEDDKLLVFIILIETVVFFAMYVIKYALSFKKERNKSTMDREQLIIDVIKNNTMVLTQVVQMFENLRDVLSEDNATRQSILAGIHEQLEKFNGLVSNVATQLEIIKERGRGV